MKLILQPNSWSCTLAAAAMTFNKPIWEIVRLLGHDGSEVIAPTLPEPARRKGIHIQEVVDLAHYLGYTMTPIEAQPVQLNSEHHEYDLTKWSMFKTTDDRFRYYLDYNIGILVGKAREHWHTVAWDGGRIYDPNGRMYSLDDCLLDIQTFWMITKSERRFCNHKIKSARK